MATKIDRLGETRMMNCGMEATIIRYGRCDDIDVRFEDGAVAKNKTYKAFKKGEIANTNIKASAEDRLGETRMMSCGMEATIIRYRNAGDIDVRFEDGTVTKHKKYYTFKKRQIANPNINFFAETHLGEIRMMNCGMKATIVRYRKYTDIDVCFEDGVVAKHKEYKAFKKGSIARPAAKNRLGETRMMNCGMEATIIRYGRSDDIDVRFKDGAIAKCKGYKEFKKGEIAHPSTVAENRLGETRMMNCGIEATIIRYGRSDDIDVRFEDGTVAKNKTYRAFKKGKIASQNIKASAENRLGETKRMNCGMEATIIRYGGCNDIDVRFGDGTIVKHRTYDQFKKGSIAHPNTKVSAKDRLSETRMMNCGMEATIIRYGGCNDIDVRFEDGKVAVHKAYNAFEKGEIANPNMKASAENRLGETRMMNCGMEATIIRYGGATDIDVRFEDGAVTEHKGYKGFKKGGIAHQLINLKNGSKDFHGFICKQGFIDEDRTLYECICKHCGLEDVLTPQEMMKHEKSEHGEDK